MKDQVIDLVEAVRLARLELACYRDPQCRASPEWTLQRLSELLDSAAVRRAMAALVPQEDIPSIVPQTETEELESEQAPSRTDAI